MADNDELVSQFLAFTGSSDTDRAASYLEMSNGNLETAVGLFMEHQGAGGGGGGGSTLGGVGDEGGAAAAGFGRGVGGGDEIRAPDATRTMRLMDDIGGLGGGMMMMGGDGRHRPYGGHPYMALDPMIQQQLASSAFARDAVNNAAAAVDAALDTSMGDGNDDDDDDDFVDIDGEEKDDGRRKSVGLADMFAPPKHLMYTEGGFDGARNMAKDSKRWLLVNLQRDSEFSCHALNRDVWRDELVENLIREGFIFWQSMDVSQEGAVYAERYKVYDYPHVGIIDPRTRRLMWKKEGWTQEKPLTAEQFAETAMDFCSRHSFDKPPQAPRSNGATAAATRPAKRPMHELSEEEQLQVAMRASLRESGDMPAYNDDEVEYIMDDDDDDEVQVIGTKADDGDLKPPAADIATTTTTKEAKAPSASSFFEQLLSSSPGEEPGNGARIQFRLPNGTRQVRKFDVSNQVRLIYAFVAQSLPEVKDGKQFVLMAGYPPKDLLDSIDSTIESGSLAGETITVRWK